MSALATGDDTRDGGRPSWHADALLAGMLLVAAILSAALGAVAGIVRDPASLGWVLLYGVGTTAPLALRRRYPNAVAIVVTLAYFAGGTARVAEFFVGSVALFVAIYTVGAWVDDRRRAATVRLAIVACMFIWLTVITFIEATDVDDDGLSRAGFFSPFVAFTLIQFLFNIAYFAGATVLGNRAHAARLQREALVQRTAELEAEREVTSAQAVALERIRIARELHDVVAHHVSAMGVQAGAARTALDRDPEAARRALVAVETSSREALGELHDLLETLRAPGGETPDSSTLRLDALPDLATHATEHGLPTQFSIVGDAVPVPDLVQVNLYRITQEALTNARRHAGPDATADVRLRYANDPRSGTGPRSGTSRSTGSVEIEIANTGRRQPNARAGLGMLGMRERATTSGGSFEAAARSQGGYLIRVRIPLEEGAG